MAHRLHQDRHVPDPPYYFQGHFIHQNTKMVSCQSCGMSLSLFMHAWGTKGPHLSGRRLIVQIGTCDEDKKF